MGIMSLAESLDLSIEILKKYLKTIILFRLGYTIILFLLFILLCVLGGIFLFITLSISPNTILIGIGMALLIIIAIALSLSSNIGMINITHQEFSGDKFYANNAINSSTKSIFKVIEFTFMSILIFTPILAIFSFIFFYLYSSLNDPQIFTANHSIERITLIIISILVALASIFIVFSYLTLLIFSLQAMTIENKGILGSLRRSLKLVKNNFWRILGSLLLLYLTLFVFRASIESFFTVMLGGLYLVLKFLNVHVVYNTFASYSLIYISWPLTILFWLLISPLMPIVISVLYFNQRYRDEGLDIRFRLNELQNNAERMMGSESSSIDYTHKASI